MSCGRYDKPIGVAEYEGCEWRGLFGFAGDWEGLITVTCMLSFDDSKYEPVNPLQSLLNITTLKLALFAKCAIYDKSWLFFQFIIQSVYFCCIVALSGVKTRWAERLFIRKVIIFNGAHELGFASVGKIWF